MSHGDWKELFLAACEGDLALLAFHLESGIDPNHVHPEYQSTPLVACLLEGQAEAALLLLDHGADPHQVSPLEAMTPAAAAARSGLSEPLARLLALGAEAPTPPQKRRRWPRVLGFRGSA